jgi:hypothetical protein
MDLSSISASNLNRCSIGAIESVESIVTGLRYVRSKFVKDRGSYLEKDADEIYVSMDGNSLPKSWVGKGMEFALVGRPAIKLPMFPQASYRDPGRRPAGSLKFIEWGAQGLCLVIATDPNFIADQWLGFVPLDLVKALVIEAPKE